MHKKYEKVVSSKSQSASNPAQWDFPGGVLIITLVCPVNCAFPGFFCWVDLELVKWGQDHTLLGHLSYCWSKIVTPWHAHIVLQMHTCRKIWWNLTEREKNGEWPDWPESVTSIMGCIHFHYMIWMDGAQKTMSSKLNCFIKGNDMWMFYVLQTLFDHLC